MHKKIFVLFCTLQMWNYIFSDEYCYEEMYRSCSSVMDQDTAILVVAFNRPDYLQQCIKSIEANPESEYMPCIFALDGGPKSKQEENIALIEESSIKRKIILLRDRNYGCPKNHIDAKRFAFNWCNFKRVIITEDDILISPQYIRFILNLHDWATTKYDNIGAVQAWSYCFLPASEKQKKLDLVRENDRCWSFVTYCIDLVAWKKIEPVLYTYESFIDEIPSTEEFDKARSKPSFWFGAEKIRQWIYGIVNGKKDPGIHQGSEFLASRYNKLFRDFFKRRNLQPNQDNLMGLSFFMNDLIKLSTVVNRAIHIGAEGISFNQDLFIKHNYHKIILDTFTQDCQITKFNLC